jgi:hypothetical protein
MEAELMSESSEQDRPAVAQERARGPWREPAEETTDYPRLWVRDDRVSGSITLSRSRLPLWCLVAAALGGWDEVRESYPQVTEYGWPDAEGLIEFVRSLTELRGDFGRLLCVLADVERQEANRTQHSGDADAWWERDEDRARVRAALRRCLEALGDDACG